MAIKPVKYALAGGLGLAHVGTLYLDESQGWAEPFKRAEDYPQTIGFVLGLADAALELSEEGEIGETLAIASEPLLIRSIYEAVKHYTAGSSSKEAKGKQPQGKWKLIRTGGPQLPSGGAGAALPGEAAPLVGL